MEHKVEIHNRGDMALEVVYGDENVERRVLNPDERIAVDAKDGIGIGPCVIEAVDPAPAEQTELALENDPVDETDNNL